MYSFQPLADIPVTHGLMFMTVIISVFCLAVCLMNESELFFQWFFIATIACGVTYVIDYHVFDQSPQTFKNEKVVGTFVGYESEGYKERSGKSYVDKHFTYVIYKVPEGNVMLPCKVGSTYPERATLYKN